MHDPDVVAFDIKRPWPERSEPMGKERWRFRGSFWTIAGHGLYWPDLVTVWHREPGGRDALTVCRHGRIPWQLHVHHWRIQVPPLQALRRRLLTRCEWCGGRSRKRDVVNHSQTWDGLRSPWWRGERGLFHSDCSSIEQAHRACVCEDPLTDHSDYGRCVLCCGYRGYGRSAEHLAQLRVLKAIPAGQRGGAS